MSDPIFDLAFSAAEEALEEINVRGYTRRAHGKAVHVRDYVRGQGHRVGRYVRDHPFQAGIAVNAVGGGLAAAHVRHLSKSGAVGRHVEREKYRGAPMEDVQAAMLDYERRLRDAEAKGARGTNPRPARPTRRQRGILHTVPNHEHGKHGMFSQPGIFGTDDPTIAVPEVAKHLLRPFNLDEFRFHDN